MAIQNRLLLGFVIDFFVWLKTEYQPKRKRKNHQPLSAKTIYNAWVTLSAFFTWACKEFDIPRPMKLVPVLQQFELLALFRPAFRRAASARSTTCCPSSRRRATR